MASTPDPVDMLPPMENQEICHGMIKLGEKLGSGTFGAVHKARVADEAPLPADADRDVAVKCIPYADYDDYHMSLLQNECKYHMKLSERHEGILKMCCVDDEPATKIYYIITELCGEDSLFEWFKKDKFIRDDENIRDRILQLIDAVEFMHGEGIFHCDLKPENILIRKNGKFVVADFGMSTDNEFEEAFKGSPSYLPPELLNEFFSDQDNPLSWREVDVWSLGTILFAMVVGCLPWSSAIYSMGSEYRQFCIHRENYFSSLGAELSPEAQALFVSLFERNREQRLTDLTELKREVMNIKTFGTASTGPGAQFQTNIQRGVSEPIFYIDPDDESSFIDHPRGSTSFPVRIMRKILNFALPPVPRGFMSAALTHASSLLSSSYPALDTFSETSSVDSDGPETPETHAVDAAQADAALPGEVPAFELGEPAVKTRKSVEENRDRERDSHYVQQVMSR